MTARHTHADPVIAPQDWADMREAAQIAGLSYDRFKKIWRNLVRTKGLPAPYLDTPYRWIRARLIAWRDASAEARRAELLTARQDAEAANDAAPLPRGRRQNHVAAARARTLQRMRG